MGEGIAPLMAATEPDHATKLILDYHTFALCLVEHDPKGVQNVFLGLLSDCGERGQPVLDLGATNSSDLGGAEAWKNMVSEMPSTPLRYRSRERDTQDY